MNARTLETRALRSLNDARRRLSIAEAKRDAARKHLAAAEVRYAEARPLTEDEREIMALHVLNGEPLCCEEGLVYLRSLVPGTWAERLNEWAYSELGCSGAGAPLWELWADRVRGLRLDRLP